MYRVGVVVSEGLVNWFCVREFLEDCLDTIAYNQRQDYDACEYSEYTYEGIADDEI